MQISVLYGWYNYQIELLTSGLINRTWKVTIGTDAFVLQQINTNIFVNPATIDKNLQLLKTYLSQQNPSYLFVAPIAGIDGKTLYAIDNQTYRAFNYIAETNTVTVVTSPKQAYQAAKQFGKFTHLLNGFDARKLQPSLPNFHNLPLRYQQFLQALQIGNQQRITACAAMVDAIKNKVSIVEKYEAFIANPAAKQRVTHHDTKISNVLFDANEEAVCVIDLDTVMPGYFISDVGDMIRTYACPVSEDEPDTSKIIIRTDVLKAIQLGYYSYMKPSLTDFEKQHFFFAGEVLIYMQALRFFTDYLQNDIYYPIKYPEHNLVRTSNQMQLLEMLQSELQKNDYQ